MLPWRCSYMSCILGIPYDMTYILTVCLKIRQTKPNTVEYHITCMFIKGFPTKCVG